LKGNGMAGTSEQAASGSGPAPGGVARGLLAVAVGVLAFSLACLVAGFTQVAFAISLPEASAFFARDWIERVGPTAALVLFSTALSALFSAPFALVGVLFAWWRGIGGALYYALVGMAIAAGGFVALRAAELPGEPTIINPYALIAYLASGLLAGLTYGALAGRRA